MPYTSKSQMARVLSESWISTNGYCLACDSEHLVQTAANTQARDFECGSCGHPYELKSSQKAFGIKVVDGAYGSMIRRVESRSMASFLLLRYSGASISHLTAVHHTLITKEVIEERRPLSITAKRAGWVGCNILLGRIPPEGRISLIDNGLPVARERTRDLFRATERLAVQKPDNRNWSRAILNLLHTLPGGSFRLEQVYEFERELAVHYPQNKNIRPKIRQQLQVLRDAGLLAFEGSGRYRLVYGRL